MKLLACNSQCDCVNTGTLVFVKNKSYFTVIMIFWTKKEVIIAVSANRCCLFIFQIINSSDCSSCE